MSIQTLLSEITETSGIRKLGKHLEGRGGGSLTFDVSHEFFRWSYKTYKYSEFLYKILSLVVLDI